jgi:3-hydroxyisobutyrate dehydrogenase-like beta-hydroxyacid dehydrogenase
MTTTIGILGFGTVGTALCRIFNKAGFKIYVYDKLWENGLSADVELRANEVNARLTDLADLINNCTYIISAVTTDHATALAAQCAPYLNESKCYIDVNSTSPNIKIDLGKIIQSTGATFIEGVILNVVNPGSTDIHMLTGGDEGDQIAELLHQAGIHSKFYSAEIGKASTFKMLRSIFSKGVEVLLLEMMMTAHKAGIEAELWQEIVAFIDSKSFKVIGESWMHTHAASAQRRYHEMQQVIDTMRDIGITPVMTAATHQFFKRSIEINLNSPLNEIKSSTDVVSLLADRTGTTN